MYLLLIKSIRMESKLPLIGTTIFTKMSLMAAENKAINLAQGFPNYPIDTQLQNLISEHSTLDVHQYAQMQGNLILRQEIANLINKNHKCKIDPKAAPISSAQANTFPSPGWTIALEKDHSSGSIPTLKRAPDKGHP